MANIPKNQNLVFTKYFYRLTFSKTGRAKFISHLDLMRAVQRTLKRAKLPVWYTQGFNPHPYIMFPLALSLGTESEIEPMDIALLEKIPFDELKERMNKVLPVGLKIESVSEPVCEHTDIYKSEYHILLQTDKSPLETKMLFEEFLSQEQLLISKRVKEKRTRKISYKDVDVKEHVELVSIKENDDYLEVILRLSTSAGNTFNLNFMPVLEAFSSQKDVKITSVSAKRTKILCKNGEIFT